MLTNPIKIAFTPEFDLWFIDWSKKNSIEMLHASDKQIQIGAFLEYNYIKRGCIPDDVKYRDVIIPKEVHNLCGIVDCKTAFVKTGPDNLMPSLIGRLRSRLHWFNEVKIDYIHQWYYDSRMILTPMFALRCSDGAVFKLE
jgi:hypothetical protein